jgi:hypothetical protein
MKLAMVLVVLAAAAACGDARPGKLVNPKVDLAAFPPHDAQLLFQTDAGLRAADLRTHTVFDVGPRGFVIADVTDDGRVVALVDAHRPVLAIVRDGVERGRVTLPRYPSHVSLAPSGEAVAGAYSYPSTAESTDALFHLDTATLELTQIPETRRGRSVAQVGWTTEALVATTDDNRLPHGAHDAHVPVRVDGYDIAHQRRISFDLAAADLRRTHHAAVMFDTGGPATCTTSDGVVHPGGWQRLADIRDMVTHPHVSPPVRSWDFIAADCSLHIVHDHTLYLVSPTRHAVTLGPVSHLYRPTAFPGAPFTAR